MLRTIVTVPAHPKPEQTLYWAFDALGCRNSPRQMQTEKTRQPRPSPPQTPKKNPTEETQAVAAQLLRWHIMARKDSILKLHTLLVNRRDALRKALAGDLSLLKALPEQTGGDVIDAALDAAQDEISSKLAEVESRELVQIDTAIERIGEGTYGQCDVCNNKIPLARLNALPYAMTCIDCQRAVETHGGSIADLNMSLEADVSFSDSEV